MCTIGAKKINGNFYLFKNRDRSDYVNTKIITENNVRKILIVDEKKHCEGLNEYGVGFIEATLSPYGIKSYKTVSQIGRKMLNQNTIDDMIEVVRRNKISSNIIVSDGNKSYIVERTPKEISVTKILNYGVITNHSLNLDSRNGPKKDIGRKSSEIRLSKAKSLVKDVCSIKDIENLLSDKTGEFKIYNHTTLCSFIFDLINKKILFYNSIPNKGNFKEYKL